MIYEKVYSKIAIIKTPHVLYICVCVCVLDVEMTCFKSLLRGGVRKKRVLDLIIKLWLRFKSRHLILRLLGNLMVCESLGKRLVVHGKDTSPPVHPT
jgi:hypothetical protein